MASSGPVTRRPASRGQRAAQLLAPGAVIAIVGLMIVPLPPLLLDLLLTIDIGLAVVLLLTAIT
jgi:flagellar biosynthesis component FlhA